MNGPTDANGKLTEEKRTELLGFLPNNLGTADAREHFMALSEQALAEFVAERAAAAHQSGVIAGREFGRGEAADTIVDLCEKLEKQLERFADNIDDEDARKRVVRELQLVTRFRELWEGRISHLAGDGPASTLHPTPQWVIARKALESSSEDNGSEDSLISSWVAGIETDPVALAAYSEMARVPTTRKGGQEKPLYGKVFALRLAASWKEAFGVNPGLTDGAPFAVAYDHLCEAVGEKELSADTLSLLFKAVPEEFGGPLSPAPRGRRKKSG